MPRMTLAEYNSLLARRAKGDIRTNPDGCSDEAELHAQIIAECNRRGWIVFHGSMAHATFRTPGEPDFVVLAGREDSEESVDIVTQDCAADCRLRARLSAAIFSNPRTYLIEAKTRTGKLSTDQRAIHTWAEKLGHTVHVVRSFGEFLEVIK